LKYSKNEAGVCMATPYIVIGCPTTGGGQVISGDSTFLVDGIAIACVGDKATCPKHKTVATIISGDPHMQVMGKAAARVNDSLSCGCKLLPKQSLVVQENGASTGTSTQNSEQTYLNSLIETIQKEYGHRFELKDELTGEPLPNVCYEILKNGEIIHGTTDDKGFTQEITSDKEEEITLRVILEEHQHG